jgi:regulator of protease activity HflC (stomatin/prohibitin superfamily)
MKKLAVFLAIPIVLLVMVRFCVQKVPVDHVGVKILQLKGGAVQQDYDAGYVFCVPGLHRLELMDRTLQFFHIAEDGDTRKPLQLLSSDQYKTQVDVTVVYRLKEGEAHKALVLHGPGNAFTFKLRSYADKYILQELAKLQTEDFYDPAKRQAGSRRTMEGMNADLVDQHLVVTDVLIRNVKYDPSFERKLLDKQLLDQQQQLQKSKAQLEGEKEKTELIQKETEARVLAINEERKAEVNERTAVTTAKIAQIQADAEFYAKKLLAEADNYMRTKTAEGELLKTQAQATGEKAINAAYAQPGGELYLVKQMVENIELGSIEINTNKVNPFDVWQMLDMLGMDPAEFRKKIGK